MPQPIGLAQPLGGDLDAEDRAAATLPVPASAGLGAVFREATHDFTDKAARYVAQQGIQAPEFNPADPARAAFDAQPRPKISADEANHRFGVEGLLRFNQPVEEDDAAWQGSIARRKLLDGTILARSHPSPLLTFGAGLAGSLFDPAGLTTMLATGGAGDFVAGGLGLRAGEEAAATGAAVSRLGKLANAGRGLASPLVTGAVDNTPYVAASYGLSQAEGEDYSAPDALRDIAAGAILHTSVHLATRAAGRILGGARAPQGEPSAYAPAPAFEPNPVPASGVPDAVDALPPQSRQGAFALALDQMANDEPVDVGRLVEQELTPPDLARLDEATAEPAVQSFRPGDADVAVTTRGTEIPVRYGLAELDDLATSHDDNLGVNPDYPAELQPRARDRAGAQARNYQLEQELNPKLLMGDVGAGSGAPIVAPDGTVESGNGRAIALRRSANTGTDAYTRYRAALEAAGHDTAGMKKPVLVRMRSQALEGAQRAALAREMNADVTERMGATEQAKVDASRISDVSFEQLPEGKTPWGSREFARDFIARAAPDQANALANADGSLSPEGERRIKAAVLQRAYGDDRLTAQAFEGEETDARKLAEALAAAAPEWARMRAAAALGTIPRELDLTANLTTALDLVRQARREGVALAQLVKELTGQGDIFSGSALSQDTLHMLRTMYGQGLGLKVNPKLAAELKDYARQSLQVQPGEDLFGKKAGIDTARDILANVAQKFAAGDAGAIDIVRPPGPSRGEAIEAGPVISLERPEPKAEAPAASEPPGEAARPAKVTGDQIIAADPELRELLKATERLEAENGVKPEVPEAEDPNTLAEAIRAAAVCLAEEGS